MPVNVELPEGIWKIIDNNFKLNGESDSEILSKIIKKHLAQNGSYPDADSLIHGTGLKDIVDILDDMLSGNSDRVIELMDRHVFR